LRIGIALHSGSSLLGPLQDCAASDRAHNIER
jgi:hypothetical protein